MTTFQEQLNQNAGVLDKFWLTHCANTQEHRIPKRKPIPKEDLIVLEKLYHKDYPDCGRKRGALLRYIKFFREEYETPDHLPNLIKHIKRTSNETRL